MPFAPRPFAPGPFSPYIFHPRTVSPLGLFAPGPFAPLVFSPQGPFATKLFSTPGCSPPQSFRPRDRSPPRSFCPCDRSQSPLAKVNRSIDLSSQMQKCILLSPDLWACVGARRVENRDAELGPPSVELLYPLMHDSGRTHHQHRAQSSVPTQHNTFWHIQNWQHNSVSWQQKLDTSKSMTFITTGDFVLLAFLPVQDLVSPVFECLEQVQHLHKYNSMKWTVRS